MSNLKRSSLVHMLAIVMAAIPLQRVRAQGLEPLPMEPPAQGASSARAASTAPTMTRAPLRMLPSGWREWLPPLPEPVFEASVAVEGDWVAVVGGFDRNLKAVPYVQLHHPADEWLPIASQVREPRAQHVMMRLPNGAWLVCGGVTGAVGEKLTPLASCELIRIPIAGNSAVEPLNEPVARPTAHRLSDERVVVVGGSQARVFDPARMNWAEPAILHAPREDHASVRLKNDTVLVICGDRDGLIEEVEFLSEHPISMVWPARLGRGIGRAAVAVLGDGRVLVVGGFDQSEGRTTNATWVLDPTTRTVAAGPTLPIEDGVAGAFLRVRGQEAFVLGGEWRSSTGRGEAGLALAIRLKERNPVWRLMPLSARNVGSTWVDFGRTTGVIGGYRFVDPATAGPHEHSGPVVEDRSWQGWMGLSGLGD